jgi:DNA-binding transcriptional regulator of glucitol operon
VLKAFLTPKWLARHALLLAAVVVLGWIGWWQWDKALAAGDWQNYGYALQWWLFGGFAVFLWVKVVLDELDPDRAARRSIEPELPVPDRRPVAPPVDEDEDEDEDEELAAYNRHLRRLAEGS